MGMIRMGTLGLLLVAQSALAEAPAPKGGFDWKELRSVPLLSGGRLKPLDSYAREVVLFITGTRHFKGWDPVELMASWISEPSRWENEEFIQVSREDVRRQIGVDEKRGRFSPHELVASSSLAQYAQRMSAPSNQPMQVGLGGVSKEDPREKELRRVMERVGLYRNVISGEAWPLIPAPGEEAWHSLASQTQDGGEEIRRLMGETMISYRDGQPEEFTRKVAQTKQAVIAKMDQRSDNLERSLSAEVLYNRWHPFRMSWILYLLAALAGTLNMGFRKTLGGKGEQVTRWGLFAFAALGVAVHVAGMALRSYISGRPPVTNMYESVIWVAFGAMAFAWILFGVTQQTILLVSASVAATFALIVADSAPAVMDPSIQPLVPVLRSNLWLTIHVLTITLGYAAFTLSLALGNVTLFQYIRASTGKGGKQVNARILSLNQLTYRATQFGVVLLAAGTILGGIWADYSWGRFWGWDPKEVWALIALLGYIAILHARYTGWVGQFGFAAWSVVAYVLVVMAWYGVNFVLGAGLHSYGFSSGGQGTVAVFTLAQLAYVAAAYALFRGKKRSAAA
jgi:cytochrome c-type biogenesis protein CcsB